MVGPDDLTNAVGLNSAAFNLARILGPALAGLLIHAFGDGTSATGWVILVNAVSYLAVIAQLQRMDVALLHSPLPKLRARPASCSRACATCAASHGCSWCWCSSSSPAPSA